ncbi:hypothetical protein U1Q18_007873 [Sarracenia purpurea var. burkii]
MLFYSSRSIFHGISASFAELFRNSCPVICSVLLQQLQQVSAWVDVCSVLQVDVGLVSKRLLRLAVFSCRGHGIRVFSFHFQDEMGWETCSPFVLVLLLFCCSSPGLVL